MSESKLNFDYSQGLVKALDLNESTDLVIRILQILPPQMTIHRLMAESPSKDELVAPFWTHNKNLFLNQLRFKMLKQNIKQGDGLNQLVI